MATTRAAAKPKRKRTTRSGAAKTSDAGLRKQVDDPIIIKGGSISLAFDQHNFEDITASPGDKNKKFDHAFQPPLKRIKIFRNGTIYYQTALNATDAIMICYAGSECPDVLP